MQPQRVTRDEASQPELEYKLHASKLHTLTLTEMIADLRLVRNI